MCLIFKVINNDWAVGFLFLVDVIINSPVSSFASTVRCVTSHFSIVLVCVCVYFFNPYIQILNIWGLKFSLCNCEDYYCHLGCDIIYCGRSLLIFLRNVSLENGGSTLLQNVSNDLLDFTASHPVIVMFIIRLILCETVLNVLLSLSNDHILNIFKLCPNSHLLCIPDQNSRCQQLASGKNHLVCFHYM
jgi:hypothetical protein